MVEPEQFTNQDNASERKHAASSDYAHRRGEPPTKKRSKSREFAELMILVVVVVFVTAGLKLFVIDVNAVPTGSMIPAIEEGDRLLVEKVSLHFTPVKAQEIVTFPDPTQTGQPNQRVLIKRVIAVGGQTVDLNGGKVYIDGVEQDEPYAHDKPSLPLAAAHGMMPVVYPVTIPEGMIWVMGDNRTDSADSRCFGPVDASTVNGKALLTVWPFDHFGTL
ncbi:MAG: signal peptidase I [Actinomycetia bacterium]|nr:signal peptidase I [Actinomycetes bacterium]